MNTPTTQYQQLNHAIAELPLEALPELASFIEYLRFKAKFSSKDQVGSDNGAAFLLSIAGLGSSDEDDVSEHDEEILANEIDPIRGWSLKRDNSL